MQFQQRVAWRLTLVLVSLSAGLLLGERASTEASVLSAQTCGQAQPSPSKSGFPEVRGVATHGVKLWALLFYHPPAVAGTDLKIVVRMTASGPFHISAIGPGGQFGRRLWIEPHTGSNWNRPGDEWGTGWKLPTAGCWRLHVTRRHARGNIWLQVAQAPQPR